jgi:hypothetical protein
VVFQKFGDIFKKDDEIKDFSMFDPCANNDPGVDRGVCHFTSLTIEWLRRFVVYEAFQFAGADGVLELADCFCFDLADALAGHLEDSADFL